MARPADKGYDADHFVTSIEATGAEAVIPPRSNRLAPREFDQGDLRRLWRALCPGSRTKNRHARLTERLRAWVEALTELLPIAHVAKLTGLHWHTIKEIDKARLQRKFGAFEGRGVGWSWTNLPCTRGIGTRPS